MRCARSATSNRPLSARGADSARDERRVGLCCLLAIALCGCDRGEPVIQPIDFSHKRHVEAQIDCLTCHEQVADGPAATLPPLRVCAACLFLTSLRLPDEAPHFLRTRRHVDMADTVGMP